MALETSGGGIIIIMVVVVVVVMGVIDGAPGTFMG
jgi:hypothetical protein